jgi:hypothetical protein
MKRIIIIAALAGLLVGCDERGPAPKAKVNRMVVVASSNRISGNDILKTCDHGRAIYSVDDDNSAALAVVLDAPECRGR